MVEMAYRTRKKWLGSRIQVTLCSPHKRVGRQQQHLEPFFFFLLFLASSLSP